MPVESLQRALHIRRKKNAHVFRNIARLWEIGEQVETHQQILDQLHPVSYTHLTLPTIYSV